MYTSGCPKNQKTCCQMMALPPCVASKKCVPAWRSSISSVSPTPSAGSTAISISA